LHDETLEFFLDAALDKVAVSCLGSFGVVEGDYLFAIFVLGDGYSNHSLLGDGLFFFIGEFFAFFKLLRS
jgi:hypothetical protein